MAVPQQRAPMLDAMGVLKEAWALFAQQWQAWVLMSLVFMLVMFTCIGVIFVPPLLAGMYLAAFKQMRGQAPQVGDMFQGMSWFASSWLLHIIVGILVGIGLLLCIIPGLLLMTWWFFAMTIMLSKNLGATDAMAMSKAKVSEGFWDVAVLVLLIWGVNVVANWIPFGFLVSMPLQTLMVAVAHRDLFGLEGALPPVGRDPAPAFQGQPPQGAICPKCNAVNSPGTKFCTGCGQQMA